MHDLRIGCALRCSSYSNVDGDGDRDNLTDF